MSRWRQPDGEQLRTFEAFVGQRERALTALARGLSSAETDAEDLLQETLVKVLEHWDQVSGAEDPYLYARRLMVNTSTSVWRRRRREMHRRSAEDVLASGGSEADLLWHHRGDHDQANGEHLQGRQEQVLARLRLLPARQRAVIALRYLEDLPDDRVAELLDIKETTVRSTALRALRALRLATNKPLQVP